MSTAEGREVFAFAGFSLDPRQRLLYGADGEPVPLSARAFDTLLYLVEHPDELIDKQTLLKAVWPNVIVEENNLNQNIAAIRRALRETPGEHRFIVTVPGRGFRFVPNVSRLDAVMAPEDAPAPQEPALSFHDPARHSASRKVEASAVETRGADPPSVEGKRWVPFATSALAAAATLAAALLAFLYFQQRPTTDDVVRFEATLPEETAGGFAIAPDGRKMAYMVRSPNGNARLWVRSFETLGAEPVDGIEDADPVSNVFWSPDSRSVGFPSHGKLKRIDLAGGPALTICDAPTFKGGSWSRSGEIVFGTPLGLMKVPASGGLPTPLTSAGFAVPSSFLPDGRHFIYMQPTVSQRGVYVGTVDAKPGETHAKKLLNDTAPAFYTPSANGRGGYLVYVHVDGGFSGEVGPLLVQPFDPQRLELTGAAVPIAERIPNSRFSVSAANVLVYSNAYQDVASLNGARGVILGQLTWFDREGKVLARFGDPGSYRTLELSPDGTRVAFDRGNPRDQATRNIWIYEFAHGITTRFTFAGAWETNPVWSPDGSRIVYAATRGEPFNLYQKAANLAEEDQPLFESKDSKLPTSWSPDGRFLLYYNAIPPFKIWLLQLGGTADRKPERMDSSEVREMVGRFSPDGHWIAYTSIESQRPDIYVRPFNPDSAAASAGSGPSIGGKWMVSSAGGNSARWRRDGKELFYLSLDGTAMAVQVNTSGVFQAGTPQPLFKVPAGVLFWDVSADGKEFLMAAPSTTSAAAQPNKVVVVLNWQAALKK